ncbi:HD domain-containing phosphohydrolase [Deinococcus hohokamensis]|uniref:HD domain-containing phosphohydrolase n=1 Tax=Deinococcus hohokamensis TaxID=309883 RepID=A0ABV9I710_9DEIO
MHARDTERETAALRALLDLSAQLLGAHTVREVETVLTDATLRLMRSRYVYFLSVTPRQDALLLTYASGEADPPLGLRLPRRQGLAWQAALAGPAVLMVDKHHIPGSAVRVDRAPDQHLLYAPLITSHQELLGVLTLGRIDPPFSAQDQALLLAFAHAGTVALERAREEQKVAQAREDTLLVLGLAMEARDYETQGHTRRTVALSQRLGRVLGLETSALDDLRQGGYLHDLGKLNTPDRILLKPGPLDQEEWTVMRQHTLTGETLARRVPGVTPGALQVIRSHHERWDGQGYPDGLAGEAIPVLARLFSLVDVYDALTHQRPYHAPLSPKDALTLIQAGRATQFDPALLDAFLQVVQDGDAES